MILEKKVILRYYDISDYFLNDLYGSLSSCCFGYEKNKIRKYVKENDQKRSLLGKIAIVKMIAKLLKIDQDELVFSRDSFEKPILEKPFLRKLNFNIAHSGKYVIVGVNSEGKIGVDIEKIKLIDLEIMKNVFMDKEIKYVNSNKKEALKKFYQIWSLKESFVKAIGEGLSYPLKKFHFEFKNGKIIHKIDLKKSKWQFKMYNVNNAYKTAVCLENGNFPTEISRGNLL